MAAQGMLMTKLKNRINAHPGNWEFKLRNIKVNEDKRGCSGFIKNLDNGVIVYINTEQSSYGPLSNQVLYRTADNFRDYTGHQNRFGEVHNEEFINDIINTLHRG